MDSEIILTYTTQINDEPEVKYELRENPTQEQVEQFYGLTSNEIAGHWFQMH